MNSCLQQAACTSLCFNQWNLYKLYVSVALFLKNAQSYMHASQQCIYTKIGEYILVYVVMC